MARDEGTTMPLAPDDPVAVDGHRLLARLGEGGQGRVYLAEAPSGDLVAVKVLLPEVAADPVARRPIADQLELTRHLPRSAVVRLLAANVEAEPPYLVSEYVPGPSLADRVRVEGPLHGQALVRVMVDTLDALATVHRAGVVHHDFKPANVLLGPEGPRIADFDLALPPGALDPTADDEGVLGSAAFLAPERLDAGPAVRASDVFAWAATAVYAATGRSPFHATDVAGVVHAVEHDPPELAGVPAELVPLLEACLAKDPDRRPRADLALDRLTDLVRRPPGGAPPADPATASPGAAPPWGTAPSSPPTPPSPSPSTSMPSGPARSGIPRRRSRLGTVLPLLVGVAAPAVFAVGALATQGADRSTVPESPSFPLDRSVPTAESTVLDGQIAVPDGRTVVRLAVPGDTVVRYEVENWAEARAGERRVPLPWIGPARLLSTALSADGTRAVTLTVPSDDAPAGAADLTVWDATTGVASTPPARLLLEDAGAGGVLGDVALSADGSTVAATLSSTGTHDGVPPGRIAVRATGRLDAPLLDVPVSDLSPSRPVLSADGRWLAYATADPTLPVRPRLHVADVRAGGVASDLPRECLGPVTFAVGAPGVPAVLCPVTSGDLLHLSPSGEPAGPTLALACGRSLAPAVAPDGSAVACLGPDGSGGDVLRSVTLGGAAPVRSTSLPLAHPTALAWTASGDALVLGDGQGRFALVPRG